MEDGRCKLGLGRALQLVRLIESGCSFRAAAAESSVSVGHGASVVASLGRGLRGERASRACLRARPPVPQSCPWALSAEAEQRILRARARTNLGPAQVSGAGWVSPLDDLQGACNAMAARSGAARPKERFTRRYEWSEPGALLHMDAKQLPGFTEPGHWAHGDRFLQARRPIGSRRPSSRTSSSMTTAAWPTSRSTATTAATSPPPSFSAPRAWMAEQGCRPVQAVMTDNALAYPRSTRLQAPPSSSSTPATSSSHPAPRAGTAKPSDSSAPSTRNGRTPASGPTSTRRNRALASFLRYYNRRRPHTSLGDRPPISRVHQDRGQDS